QVGVCKYEQAACECFLHKLFGECVELPRLHCRSDDEFDREISSARKWRWRQRNNPDARNFRQRSNRLDQELLRGLLPLAPRLRYHAAETASGRRDLENTLALRERVINVIDLVGE